MPLRELIGRMRRYHRRVNGCTIEYDTASYRELAQQIESRAQTYAHIPGRALQQRFSEQQTRVARGCETEPLIVDACALVYIAAQRALGVEPFESQLVGAQVLHKGKVAEMATGEGKTLTAAFAACLNALDGKGVHVLTVNDYLARRDTNWMGEIYRMLGLQVASVQENMDAEQRRAAYAADITYVTAREAGFDFLRDSLCREFGRRVHRVFNCAIIDEADSILVDEARVPLVLAGALDEEHAGDEKLYKVADIARALELGRDFELDTYGRNLYLTEAGQQRAEALLGCDNLYGEDGLESFTHLYAALHAENLVHRDKDYIVRHGRVELVDEFTGRVAERRRWPESLQAAIEAKEQVAIQPNGSVLNSIPVQHFLRRYSKLCGMTATAQPAEEVLRLFYDLHIVVIPPTRPCIRIDYPDVLYATRAAKMQALEQEILRVHATGRPILVGTRTVRESEELAAAIRARGMSCAVLNARNDEEEAAIVAQAGALGAVTISTNMAGRGTDIRLGGADERERSAVVSLGGLYVIGTNRHASRRIDDQLRGRAGRQGDPGSSRFFISLEDDLCVKFRIEKLLPRTVLAEQGRRPIDSPVVRREVDRVQRIAQGQNLEAMITLCKYSYLIEQQRAVCEQHREQALSDHSLHAFFDARVPQALGSLRARFGGAHALSYCRDISLAHLDRAWADHLSYMDDIREGIHLRRYGQQEPVFEFHKIAIERFDGMLHEVDRLRVETVRKAAADDQANDTRGPKLPSATWTYLVNDNPWEDQLHRRMLSDIGFSMWTGFMLPLIALYYLFRRMVRGREAEENSPAVGTGYLPDKPYRRSS
ncbi:MAG: accessory Sec system translocase SecA2 [Chitinivibrionales bacterium]|nr:accessory Sec system translocase SecA2 [Chitinivibrionales bacterium]